MIRLPETRAQRRALAALGAFRESAGVLGQSRQAEAVAGHLAVMLEENVKLRAQLLALQSDVDARHEVASSVRQEIAIHLGRLG